MKEKPRLGRGIDALLSSTPLSGPSDGGRAGQMMVGIEQIQTNPFQPRKVFDPEELAGLSESIKSHGLLQPLVVREVGGQFQLVAGERRLRAAREAGQMQVPVVVVNFNDRQTMEAALAENIQRSDLNPIEKAQGFKEYLDRFGATQEELAAKLGVDRTTISNLIGLLDLAPEVQDAVRVRQISLGHAKVLKGIKDPARQIALCKEVVARGLSVHALETQIKQPKPSAEATPVESSKSESKAPSPTLTQAEPEKVEKTAHVLAIEDELRKNLAVRVEIRLREPNKGQIVLGFDSEDDFQRLLDVLRN